MEKNELEPIESSSLPLTSADAQPPLVVDLPDGQKLVVGNLDPGTVVEVATWRGTGRPDSRTNRLMLGVSHAEENAQQQSKAPTFVPSEPAAIESSTTSPQTAQVRTGIIYSEINPTSSRSGVAQFPDSKTSNRSWKTVAKIVAPVLATGLLIALLIGPLGMRVAHPQAGAGTTLGPASSSLVITRPIDRFEIGKNVIADIPSSESNPAIVVISAVSGENILLASDTGYFHAKPSNVRGSVFIVLPFIGSIFNLFV